VGRYIVFCTPEDDQAIAAVAEMSHCSEEDVIAGLISLLTKTYFAEMEGTNME